MKRCSGRVRVDQHRAGQLIKSRTFENSVTFEGLSAMMSALFGGILISDQWFLGLVVQDEAVSFSQDDTLAMHSWTESTIGGPSRLGWMPVFSDAIPQILLSPSESSTVTLVEDGSIAGVFMCSEQMVGGTTGILWSTVLFATVTSDGVTLDPFVGVVDDVLSFFYEIQMTDISTILEEPSAFGPPDEVLTFEDF